MGVLKTIILGLDGMMWAARIIALVGLFFSVAVTADLTVRYDQIVDDQTYPYQTLMLSGSLLRVDPVSPQSPTLLLNTDNGDIVQLHSPSQRYFSVNAHTLNQYVEVYRNNRSMFQGLIDHGLTQFAPEQKAQIEQALKQFDPRQSSLPPLQVSATKKSAEVLGAKCRVVSVYDREQLTAQLCIADYTQLGLHRADIENLGKLKQFAVQFRQTAPARQRKLIDVLTQGVDGIAGVPLQLIEYRNNQISRVIQAGAISLRRIPPQAYRVPSHYRARSTPML